MKKGIMENLWSAWVASLLGISVILAIADDTSRAKMFLAIYAVCTLKEQINKLTYLKE